MFRLLAAIFLLFAFAAQVFNRAIIVLDYYTNTAAFSKNCENKSRPILQCNGKCQVMKKIKEQEKKENHLPVQKEINQLEALSTLTIISSPPPAFNYIGRSYIPLFSQATCKGMLIDIFHPPGLA